MGIVLCILRNGDYAVDYLTLLAGIILTVVGVITIKITKPNQTEYDPDIYNCSKIEAEKDVKIKVSDREYLMGLFLETVSTIYIM